MAEILPPIPPDEWKATKNTLHLYCQIVGKIRLALHPKMNHWWHVSLYVTPHGLSTGTVPFGNSNFRIEFDFINHRIEITSGDGRKEDFAIYDGLTVADFHSSIFANLAKLGIHPKIKPVPYEAPSDIPFPDDTVNNSYDREFVRRFHKILVAVDGILTRFRGRFYGKSSPVHLFWHSFDLALTRFSGRKATLREGANNVEREAYSEEVISFGFWFGDDRIPAPAFYSYTAPEPASLTEEVLQPASAKWVESGGGHLAILMYDDIRTSPTFDTDVLAFLESAFKAGKKCANWTLAD